MHFNPYILDTLVIIISAVVAVAFFRAIKVSSIVGYLIAGMVVGPHALRFITDIERIQAFGEFGVVFLLFAIGLKMPLRRFQVLKRYVFGLGMAQVVVTGALFTFIAMQFGLNMNQSFIVGTGLALSSTAVGLQLLTESGDLAHKYGRLSFAVLLAQDLSVVVLLTLLASFNDHDHSIVNLLSTAGLKAAGVLLSVFIIGRLLLRPLYRIIANLHSAELFVSVTFLIVLAISMTTEAFGLSKELGAFLAGLILSETEYRHQVEADIQPFYGVLLGLFFMTVGMQIDVQLLLDHPLLILSLVGSIILFKTLVLLGLGRVFKIQTYSILRSSLLLAGGSEFLFILLADAFDKQLIQETQMHYLFLATAISMALTPLLVNIGKKIGEKLLQHESDLSLAHAQNEFEDLKNHVIICGFGRVGKMIAKLLSQRMLPYVIIDNDMNRVTEGRSRGVPIYFGDATRDSVLKSLGADKANSVVISLHNAKSTLRSALMIRRKYPKLLVAVRLEDEIYESKLAEAGVLIVKPENFEPSMQLASAILETSGIDADEVTQVIDQFRRTYRSGG